MITKISKFFNRKKNERPDKPQEGDFFISKKNNIGQIIAITHDLAGITYYAKYDYTEIEGIDSICITYPIKEFGTREEMEDVLKAKIQANKYNIL